jgi:sugar transferase (PEP-CTERM system associated)
MIQVFSRYVSLKSFLLIGLEAILIVFSLLCAVKLRFWNNAAEFSVYTDFPHFFWQALTVVLLFQICFYFNDLYDVHSVERRDDQALRLGQAIGAASLLAGLLYCLVPSLLVGRGVFFLSVVLLAGFISVWRIALDNLWRATPAQNLLILGTGGLALTVAREVTTRRDLKVNLVGYIASSPDNSDDQALLGHPIVGLASNLDSIAEEHSVSRIVVAVKDYRGALPIAALVKLRVRGVVIEDAHSTMAALTGRVWLNTVRPSWFVFSDGFHRSRLTTLIKRSLDICFGVLGFVTTLPVMLVVMAAVKLESKGPVLYRQVRVGWKSAPFEVLKFRSMRVDAEAKGGAQWASIDDPRVTSVGRFIRKFRLDELPQFVNVIRGQMSFVGPRPERPVFVDQLRKEIPYYDERHSVRPGLTGWAQVEYQYGASVEDAYRKLEYDLFYLKNMSVLFDFAIIIRTVRMVLAGKNGR